MKVKIGEITYDSEVEPIMIILTDSDKSNIKNMHPECYRYIIFPDNIDKDVIMGSWSEI